MFYDNLKVACENNGLKITPIVAECGGAKGSISNWKKGAIPNSDIVMKLSVRLNVSTDYLLFGIDSNANQLHLSENEQELLNAFKQLSHDNKMRLLGRAETLLELESQKEVEQQKKTISIAGSEYRVSAGLGIMLGDDSLTEITVPDTPESRKADFALTICGDSMEPIYHDNDIVLVRKMPSIEVGEIGIFYVDGSGYIKKYGGDRLISLNSAYDDILFDESTEIRCFGKVIGRA